MHRPPLAWASRCEQPSLGSYGHSAQHSGGSSARIHRASRTSLHLECPPAPRPRTCQPTMDLGRPPHQLWQLTAACGTERATLSRDLGPCLTAKRCAGRSRAGKALFPSSSLEEVVGQKLVSHPETYSWCLPKDCWHPDSVRCQSHSREKWDGFSSTVSSPSRRNHPLRSRHSPRCPSTEVVMMLWKTPGAALVEAEDLDLVRLLRDSNFPRSSAQRNICHSSRQHWHEHPPANVAFLLPSAP
mmetsp:Transcript_67574/g.148168  ORF Transcript_67574/g.148168 Transcript_67574/m.148168 type:complete len:243 (-) Transcript_67574:231-959(-)